MTVSHIDIIEYLQNNTSLCQEENNVVSSMNLGSTDIRFLSCWLKSISRGAQSSSLYWVKREKNGETVGTLETLRHSQMFTLVRRVSAFQVFEMQTYVRNLYITDVFHQLTFITITKIVYENREAIHTNEIELISQKYTTYVIILVLYDQVMNIK